MATIKHILFGVTVLLLTTTHPALGEDQRANVADLIKLAETNATFEAMIIGGGRALEGVNAHLTLTNQRPLYCQPGKLAMTGAQYKSILGTFVGAHPEMGNYEISLFGWVLLRAMEEVFPCGK